MRGHASVAGREPQGVMPVADEGVKESETRVRTRWKEAEESGFAGLLPAGDASLACAPQRLRGSCLMRWAAAITVNIKALCQEGHWSERDLCERVPGLCGSFAVLCKSLEGSQRHRRKSGKARRMHGDVGDYGLRSNGLHCEPQPTLDRHGKLGAPSRSARP